MSLLLLHTHGALPGSPLYRLLPDHAPGLVAVALVPIAAWIARRSAPTLGSGYRRLPAHERLLVWLLLLTAAIHAGLVWSGRSTALALLFVLDAAALLIVARRLVLGRRWRLPAGLLLVGSIGGYWIAVVAYEPPDQLGLATKLVELAAFGLVVAPRRWTRIRRLAASTATVSVVVLTGLAAWIGAFHAADAHGRRHSVAEIPGTIHIPSSERGPTPAEVLAADRFYHLAARALRKYRDTAVAAGAGYQVGGIIGSDFHAGNTRYQHDGRVFDPARPENLIYAQTAHGPVLLGAMYEMPGIGQHGPQVGGPLTEWHAHEQVCFSLLPPSLSGLVSPFGDCPAGSIAVPITPELIHLWLIPEAPTRWGDLSDKWRSSYLASLDARRKTPLSHPVAQTPSEARRRLVESGVLDRFEDKHGPNVVQEAAA